MTAPVMDVPAVVGGLARSAGAVPGALGALPAVVAGAAGPWRTAAETVSAGFAGEAGEAAAGSLARAAGAAGIVDADSADAAAALAEGLAAMGRASVELAGVVMRFVSAAAGALMGGPAGVAGVASAAAAAMAEAARILVDLEAALAGPTTRLEGVAAREVDIPREPAPAGSADGALRPANVDATPAEAGGSGTGGVGDADRADSAAEAGGADGDAAGDAPTPEARAAVRHALSAVGTPYEWGGNTPGRGLDCSGLTHWAYGQAGVDIPRTAAEQAVGTRVSRADVLPGDLVVWDGHVAMVTGDGMMVEAGDPVQVNPIRETNAGMAFKGYWRPTA